MVIGQEYLVTTPFEIRYGLIIVPVEIQGETYNFLFDTGAPTSISENLQQKYTFKKKKAKNQRDSDGSRKKILYVAIDELKIGSLFFRNQLASVYNFTLNPAIACLEIDGIIGSPSMNQSTWTVDWKNQLMTISSEPLSFCPETDFKYKSDHQNSILINITTPKSTIKNVKVDYGSTGALGVPIKIFDILNDREEFGKILKTTGYKMGGLFGKKKKLTTYAGIVPAAFIGKVPLDSFELRTGTKGLLGTKILRDYLIHIDGKNKILRLEKYAHQERDDFFTYGIGLTKNKDGVFVLNILENGTAQKEGIHPGIKILQIGDIDLTEDGGLCTYMFTKEKLGGRLPIKYIDQEGVVKTTTIESQNYYE